MTTNRRALLDRLLIVQAQAQNANRDLMTITGFMTDDQVRDHIARWDALREYLSAVEVSK